MQVQVKTILNDLQPFPGFVYDDLRLSEPAPGQARELHLTRLEHAGRPAKCSRCQRPAPGDDRLPVRAAWPGVGRGSKRQSRGPRDGTREKTNNGRRGSAGPTRFMSALIPAFSK